MKENQEFSLAHIKSEISIRPKNGNVKLSIQYESGVPEKPRLVIYMWKSTSKISSSVSYT